VFEFCPDLIQEFCSLKRKNILRTNQKRNKENAHLCNNWFHSGVVFPTHYCKTVLQSLQSYSFNRWCVSGIFGPFRKVFFGQRYFLGHSETETDFLAINVVSVFSNQMNKTIRLYCFSAFRAPTFAVHRN